jgi:RimJ/RimL family protein N-acetyltransferase
MMIEDFDLQPILENSLVILKPLKESDFEQLYNVASDPEIWSNTLQRKESKRCFSKFFKDAIDAKTALLVIERKTQKVIGTSRYNLSGESPKAIEIGWTFLAKKYWGGEYNKSIKDLMIDMLLNILTLSFFI